MFTLIKNSRLRKIKFLLVCNAIRSHFLISEKLIFENEVMCIQTNSNQKILLVPLSLDLILKFITISLFFRYS